MRSNDSLRGVVVRHRWGLLLGLLLFTYVFDTVMPSTLPFEVISRLLYIAVFSGTLLAARLPSLVSRLGLALVFIAWPLLTVLEMTTRSGLIDALNLGITALILVGCLAITFLELSAVSQRESDEIFGAIFGYFLIALAFAMLYVQLEKIHPGSFELTASDGPVSSLVYFSLVTITTLGYGDITPISKLARVVAGIEAASGVMYVAVFIARILNRRRNEG